MRADRGATRSDRPSVTGDGSDTRTPAYGASVFVDLVTVIVDDYDPAIDFFVDVLGFELIEDAPARTNDGRSKRWVVVRPPGAQTGLLLARARGDGQRAAVGHQAAGRVGFFLRVEDFDAVHERLVADGVQFVVEPRDEPYGRVGVFLDICGNRWDLLGPRQQPSTPNPQRTSRW